MILRKSKIIRGQIECVTGLYIGGSEEAIKIGGIDEETIKHPLTQEPYIPGSSLKGKMRSQMEKEEDRVGDNGQPCGCARCMVCRVFGPYKNIRHQIGPTRILVRDAMLSEESRKKMKEAVEAGKSFFEIKTENIIDRRVGSSNNFFQRERVSAGTKFDMEIVIQLFHLDDDVDVIGFVKRAIKSVEKSYIGGSGSRGYGQVRFLNTTIDDETFDI